MAEKTLDLNDLKEMVKTITKQGLKESSLKQMFDKHWNTKKKENIARKEADALKAAGEYLEGFNVYHKFLDDKEIAWHVFTAMQDPRNTESESELIQQETERFNRNKYNPKKEIDEREAQYPGFAKAYDSALAMGSKNPTDDAFNILKQQGTGPKVGEPEFDPKSGHMIKSRQHGSVRTEPEFDPKSGHVIPGSRKVVGPKFDPKSGHVIDDLDESKKLTKLTHKQLREMIREVLSEEDKVPEEKETPEDEKKELNEKTVTLEQLREMIRDGVLESMDKELTKKLKKVSK